VNQLPPVAIAGGGIGGLAAAAALAHVGIDSVVFEKQAALAPAGSAFLIGANALLALNEMGLAERYLEIGQARRTGELRTYRGRLLASVPETVLIEGLGFPNTNVERSDLRALLFEAAGAQRVRFGESVTGFEERGAQVAVQTSSGERETFAALIGADGIGSVVRKALHGPSRAKYVGYCAWQGVSMLEIPNDKGTSLEIWGLGRRTGYGYLGKGRWGWWGSALVPGGGADPAEERSESVASRFNGWWGASPALIRSTPSDKILRNDIRVRAPDRTWGRGAVTLLGDAAHLMTPDLGQGACQAIIDAAVLARALRGVSADGLQAALRRYEEIRRPQSAHIAKASARVGRHAHYRNPAAFAIRNALLRALPASAINRGGVRTLKRGGP
jgi:2-polyprenyl-6-methoxyphenol hydroxylase-like FAD-dependent oxidoreductase